MEEHHDNTKIIIGHLNDLVNSISSLNDHINSINETYSSLHDSANSVDTPVHPELNDKMNSFKSSLETKMQRTEQLLKHATDPERIAHLNKFFNLKDEMSK